MMSAEHEIHLRPRQQLAGVPTHQAGTENSEPTRQHPWWLELFLVGFRHAAWPWVGYTATVWGIAYFKQEFTGNWIRLLIFAVLATWSATVAQIFCADQAHSTLATLLTFPHSRSRIWGFRAALSAALMLAPLLVISSVYSAPDLFALLLGLSFCALTTGSLLGVLLRRPLVVWSATFISPIALTTICSILLSLFGLNSNGSFSSKFPYAPLSFLLFILFCGFASLFASWRLWLRLEVRS